jgi:integrase
MTHISGHALLVKRKRGDKWYAKWRVGERQHKRLLGPAWKEKGRPAEGYFTRRLAQAEVRKILHAEETGNGRPKQTGATFDDAATEYLRYVEDVRRVDAVTVGDYRGVVEGYLRAEFGEVPLEQITPDAIDTYKERLIAEGRLSNRTIVRHLTVLHGIFKRAKRVWGLKDNPASADLVERPKVTYTGEFDTFDRGEIERLAVAAADEQDAALYQTAAYSGLRQGELLALRWRNVDFVAGLLHVRGNYSGGQEKAPKGKRVRSVPMMRELVDVLAQLKEREHFTGEDDLVFPSKVGEHLDHYSLRRRYYAALEGAARRRIRFHDLRHAFGTAAIQKLDAYSVQSYMGHQHYSTTQRYLHHKPRAEDAAKLSVAFGRNGFSAAQSAVEADPASSGDSGAKAGTEPGTETPNSNGHKSTNGHVSRHKPTPQTG